MRFALQNRNLYIITLLSSNLSHRQGGGGSCVSLNLYNIYASLIHHPTGLNSKRNPSYNYRTKLIVAVLIDGKAVTTHVISDYFMRM